MCCIYCESFFRLELTKQRYGCIINKCAFLYHTGTVKNLYKILLKC